MFFYSPQGFPEALRQKVLKGQQIEGTDMSCFDGRPGADMPPMDLKSTKEMLNEKWGDKSEGRGSESIRDIDVMSYAMYPAVFDEVCSIAHTNRMTSHIKFKILTLFDKVHGT